MTIEHCTAEDTNQILHLYEMARRTQQAKGAVVWPDIAKDFIDAEIAEGRQWKIVIDNQMVCVWATTFSDPQIWEERNADPAVYIHRIATHDHFRGRHLVGKIVAWAKPYAHEHGKRFIRMDTVGENLGLISYYQQCGFDFLGLLTLKNTDGLPGHYANATVSLFQISLSPE